jgi:hypothetical protein
VHVKRETRFQIIAEDTPRGLQAKALSLFLAGSSGPSAPSVEEPSEGKLKKGGL